jgi:hypothetical protein
VNKDDVKKPDVLVVDDAPTTTPTEREFTMDEVRGQMARAVAVNVRKNIAAVERQPTTSKIDALNKEKTILAAKELHDSLLVMARKFERPLILRPDRSLKVVR